MNHPFMKYALEEAKLAGSKNEIPVGAVIVKNNEVISKAHNLREKEQNALCHAEIIAIHEACNKLGSWRLTGCDIYITLEPCLMCTGAIINARLDRVYFGAYDEKLGSLIKGNHLFRDYSFQTPIEIYGGIMEQECLELLQTFFQERRE